MKSAWSKLPRQQKITVGEFSLDEYEKKDGVTLDAVQTAVRAAMEKNDGNIVEIMNAVLIGIDPEVTNGTCRILSTAVAAGMEAMEGMKYGEPGDPEYDEDEEDAAQLQ